MPTFTTRQVAEMAKVHRDTLLRWLREHRVKEPGRDRNGWRAFTQKEAQAVVRFAQGEAPNPSKHLLKEAQAKYIVSPIAKLGGLDWNFADANTGYLTHSLHPYPAKFIPQIPNTIIQELSSVGEVVLDPFCGSGTTLVEALLLKRHTVGVDANPLACLIAKAKTTRLNESDIASLRNLETQSNELAQRKWSRTLPLFPDLGISEINNARPTFDGLEFWFEPHVIDELALLKSMCLGVTSDNARQVALTAFSSIIVAVSKQDSDTRYVRREKNVQPGDTTQRFCRALDLAIARVIEFTELTESRFTSRIIHANVLDSPNVGFVDLVVCSPPYPNAYSYHLYHRTRMLWLDMDQTTFKRVEIGSHRKYSSMSKKAANADTFQSEMRQLFKWLHSCLRPRGFACFVIGDSRLRGKVINNDQLLTRIAVETGFTIEKVLTRRMQDSKKSFNPVIGKIKDEQILIFRNPGT